MTLFQNAVYIRPDDAYPVTPKSTGGGAWPSGFVTPPFEFAYNTYGGPGVFEFTEQGLIAAYAYDGSPPWGGGPYMDGGYRLVTKADGTMDAIPLMEAMAQVCRHGDADEGASHAQRLSTARLRPLEMRCGHVTNFTRQIASSVGVTTRQVHLLNVTDNNYFDDGHVALEAQIGGEWKYFDVTSDIYFKDAQGVHASIADIVSAGVENCSAEMLAPHRVGRISAPNVLGMHFAATLHTHQNILEWCKRIYEVPGMLSGNGIVWGLPASLSGYASAITSYPGTNGTWSVMDFDDWVATYY